MQNKIRSYFKDFCPIFFFSKFIAIVIILAATSDLVVALAGGPVLDANALSADNIKNSIIQWLLGLVAASATVIAGYLASIIKKAIDYTYDLIRAKIANTVLAELVEDLYTFAVNQNDKLKVLFETSLKNDGKIDKDELQAMVQCVYDNAVAVWGEKKIEYIAKYRPQAKEWLKAKIEEIVRRLVEQFRWNESGLNTATAESNK